VKKLPIFVAHFFELCHSIAKGTVETTTPENQEAVQTASETTKRMINHPSTHREVTNPTNLIATPILTRADLTKTPSLEEIPNSTRILNSPETPNSIKTEDLIETRSSVETLNSTEILNSIEKEDLIVIPSSEEILDQIEIPSSEEILDQIEIPNSEEILDQIEIQISIERTDQKENQGMAMKLHLKEVLNSEKTLNSIETVSLKNLSTPTVHIKSLMEKEKTLETNAIPVTMMKDQIATSVKTIPEDLSKRKTSMQKMMV